MYRWVLRFFPIPLPLWYTFFWGDIYPPHTGHRQERKASHPSLPSELMMSLEFTCRSVGGAKAAEMTQASAGDLSRKLHACSSLSSLQAAPLFSPQEPTLLPVASSLRMSPVSLLPPGRGGRSHVEEAAV